MSIVIKEENLLPGEHYEPYEKPIVDAVEALIRLRRQKASPMGKVESNSDWEVVDKLISFWATLYPSEYSQFKKDIVEIKRRQERVGGKSNSISREKGGAAIQHQMEIPPKFHNIFRVIYPHQPFDKNFTTKFAQKFPLFKVPDRL